MSRKVLLIVNRRSRQGNSDLAAGIEVLQEHGLEVIEQDADQAAAIPDLILRHADDVDGVVLGGGDGTMNCAAGALRETGVPLGILPMGTANDLARTLRIPVDLVEACRIIAEGIVERIDLGCVNGVYFFNAASIGLGVEVTRRLSSEVKGRWGVLGYARTVYDAMRASRTFSAEVRCDGRSERLRSIQILVGNGCYYGGGMSVAGDAAIDDQRLDMYSLKPQGLIRLLALAPALRFGPEADGDTIEVRRGAEIEVHTRKRKSVSTDGELTTFTPARFHVEPGAVRVHVPTEPD